ncbi:AzlC family ABC transporter permease [Rhizobiaceae bacterium]|nr:AzlC family ABC transporter permease [Rhizobiaceae bacterium]
MSERPPTSVYDWSWFTRGIAGFGTLPSLILVSAFVGFGGLTRDAGIPLAELIFMVPLIWALPSHLIVVAGIGTGASGIAVAVAVALASLRMMPMTMALVPEIRVPGTKRWHLLAVSNLVAITAWVNLMQRADNIPPRGRLPYFTGFGLTMVVASTTVAALTHELSAEFPTVLLAGLTFLTPIYFATSLWNASRFPAERLALAAGFVLAPLAYALAPQAMILIAGIGGGLLAYAARRAGWVG